MDTPYEEPPLSAWSGGTSSACLRTPAGSSQPVTGATSAVRTPPHHSAEKDPATEDDEDDDDDDDDPPSFRRQHDQWDDWPLGTPLGTQGASQVLTKVVSLNT